MVYDVFISYRRKTGADDARLLQQALKARGYNVFFDYESLRDGKFDERIFAAIEEAPVFILLLSEGALDNCVNKNDWVRIEIEHALKHSCKIIPVSTGQCVYAPSFFRRILISIRIFFGDVTEKYFPTGLPKELLPITKEQVSELNKKGLFEESIDTIIRNRFPAGLRVSKENSVLCGKRSAKKSDAFEFGFVVALHALSFVSQWPAQENIRKQLEEWNMQGCSFEISTPDEVATFLNEFTKEFGEKWGADLEESLYLGSCFLFGVAHYLEKHNWGDWGLKIKLQCVKLNLPEQVIEKFTDKLSRDDIMLLKAQLAMALCK